MKLADLVHELELAVVDLEPEENALVAIVEAVRPALGALTAPAVAALQKWCEAQLSAASPPAPTVTPADAPIAPDITAIIDGGRAKLDELP